MLFEISINIVKNYMSLLRYAKTGIYCFGWFLNEGERGSQTQKGIDKEGKESLRYFCLLFTVLTLYCGVFIPQGFGFRCKNNCFFVDSEHEEQPFRPNSRLPFSRLRILEPCNTYAIHFLFDNPLSIKFRRATVIDLPNNDFFCRFR